LAALHTIRTGRRRPGRWTLTGLLAAGNQPLIPDHASEAHEDHWTPKACSHPKRCRRWRPPTGPTGQKLFLEGMIQHHEGALTMVQAEIDDGENPDAVQLAQTIKAGQTGEIETMKRLLADP
jgi:hypothetical protein